MAKLEKESEKDERDFGKEIEKDFNEKLKIEVKTQPKEDLIENEDHISPKPKTSKEEGKEYTIVNRMGDTFILTDSSGLGFRKPIPKKYKDASIGDKIRL